MDQMKIAAGTRYEHAAATPDVPVSKERLSDPRSCIRDLRAKGISILDEWVPSEHGSRFKRYFLRKEVRDE